MTYFLMQKVLCKKALSIGGIIAQTANHKRGKWDYDQFNSGTESLGGESLKAVLPPVGWWYKELGLPFTKPLNNSQSSGTGQEMSTVLKLDSNQAFSALFVLLTVPIAVSEDLFALEVLSN